MKNNKGFTIVELMIATVVFSLVLLLALAGIMQVTRMYYKGVNQSRTQEAARAVTDEIGETIRFTNDVVNLASVAVTGPVVDANEDNVNYLCIGSKRYTYAIDRKLESSGSSESDKVKRHVLWVDQPDVGCVEAADLDMDEPSSGFNGRELLSENMRLARLDVNQIVALGDVFEIGITVAYGDDDTQDGGPLLLNSAGTNRECRGFSSGSGGGEYCAVSSIAVTVERRLQ